MRNKPNGVTATVGAAVMLLLQVIMCLAICYALSSCNTAGDGCTWRPVTTCVVPAGTDTLARDHEVPGHVQCGVGYITRHGAACR